MWCVCVCLCAFMPACTYYHTVLSANKWLSERGYRVPITLLILRCTGTGLAFRRMYGLFLRVGALLELKIHVWIALVRPVLLYGCGTWGLSTFLTEKLCVLYSAHKIIDSALYFLHDLIYL